MPKFHYMPRTIVPRRSCFVSHCCLTCFEFFFFFDFPNHDIGHSETRYSFSVTISFLNSENFQLECRQTFISNLKNNCRFWRDIQKKMKFFIVIFFLSFFLSFQVWKKISSTSYRRSFSPITTLGIKILKFLFRGKNYTGLYLHITWFMLH